MSQKRDVRPERVPLGQLDGLEAAGLTDRTLTPGLSINGAPPALTAGDELTSVALVRCWCREVVAVAWAADRSGRGLDRLLYVVAELVEDRRARPPVVREYRRRLTPDSEHVVDCPAHGRGTVAGPELLAAVRRTEARLVTGGDTVKATSVVVSKSGRGRMLLSKGQRPGR